MTPQTSIFLSDVETDVWPKGSLAKLAAQSDRFVVTRGELGADVFSSDSTMFHFDAEKVCAWHGPWLLMHPGTPACS